MLIPKLFKFARIIFSCGLLFFIFSKVNFSGFYNILREIYIPYIVVVIFLSIIQSILSTFGWKTLLSVFKIGIPFRRLLYLYYVGGFYSLALPGTIGGDAAKIYYVTKDSNKLKESFSSLMMQRIIGLCVFFTFFLLPVLIFSDVITDPKLRLVSLIIVVSFLLITVIVFFNPAVRRLVDNLVEQVKLVGINQKLKKIIGVFYQYTKNLSSLGKVVLISMSFNVLNLLGRYMILLSLGLHIDLFYFFSFVILVTFLVQIPISFAGVGIREGSYIYFFTQLGFPSSTALAFSLIEYLPGLIINIIVGLVYLVRTGRG